MKTTLGLPVTAAISGRFRPTRIRGTGHGPAFAARGRSAAVILALVGAGLAGFARGQVITWFPISHSPHGIASGPDGNLWFTESDANKIGRITSAGVITEFPSEGLPMQAPRTKPELTRNFA